MLSLMLSSSSQAQDTRYVSDVLHLPLRSGKGNEFRITHRGMPSSTKLFVLEVDPEGEWIRVKTEDNKEGWVRSQYLIEEPTAAIKLAALEKKLASLNNGSKSLLAQISRSEKNNKKLTRELASNKKSLNICETELSNLKKISANAITLNQQHQDLLAKHQMLQAQSDTVQAENQRLNNQKNHDDWLYGAFLMICGIIVTIALQAMNSRRRKSEWG